MLCWHLFSNSTSGKVSAVTSTNVTYCLIVVPLAFTVIFWIIGEGFIRFDLITDSMSRSGVATELAKGPVHYGICISLATILYWKKVEAFYCILPIAFGDGISAFFGPSIKGNRALWWNPSKTWFGLISFVVSTYLALVVHIWFYSEYT